MFMLCLHSFSKNAKDLGHLYDRLYFKSFFKGSMKLYFYLLKNPADGTTDCIFTLPVQLTMIQSGQLKRLI